MKTVGTFLTLLLLIVSNSGCGSTSPAMFEWDSGRTLSYEIVQAQSQTIEVPGQGSQSNETESTMGVDVVGTGSRAFDMTVTSATATGSPVSVKGLEGLMSSVELAPDGTIVSATGLDDNQTVTAIGGVESFREGFQALFLVLPDEKLKPGVEWERKVEVPVEQQGLKLTRKSTDSYRVVQMTELDGNPVFEVSTSSKASISGSGSQGGNTMDISIGGTTTGTLFVEVKSGSVLKAEAAGDMIGTIDLPTASLPMSLHVESTIALKK